MRCVSACVCAPQPAMDLIGACPHLAGPNGRPPTEASHLHDVRRPRRPPPPQLLPLPAQGLPVHVGRGGAGGPIRCIPPRDLCFSLSRTLTLRQLGRCNFYSEEGLKKMGETARSPHRNPDAVSHLSPLRRSTLRSPPTRSTTTMRARTLRPCSRPRAAMRPRSWTTGSRTTTATSRR